MSKLLTNETARWLQDLRKRKPATKTRRTRTPFIGSSTSSSGGILAVITGGSAIAGYTVNLFANGIEKPKTGTGIVYLTDVVADNSTGLASGTQIIAHPTVTTLTGGSD